VVKNDGLLLSSELLHQLRTLIFYFKFRKEMATVLREHFPRGPDKKSGIVSDR
jgi:hypothetical protein